MTTVRVIQAAEDHARLLPFRVIAGVAQTLEGGRQHEAARLLRLVLDFYLTREETTPTQRALMVEALAHVDDEGYITRFLHVAHCRLTDALTDEVLRVRKAKRHA